MVNNSDEVLKSNETIFLNEIALSYDFVPREIEHRENEHHYIANSIKPLLEKRNGRNLFIYGNPGIGKTLAIKSIFLELEETIDDVLTIYLNCWKHNTSYKIILEICKMINYNFTVDKSTDELMDDLKGILNKKSIVFCFDEADKLENFDILYFILEDIYKKSLILITNERSWLDELDKRIRSRLYAELLEFRAYNYEETLDILKKRSEYAFYPNVINKDLLEKIAKKTLDLKDIRSGIYLLKESGDLAESRSSKKIIEEDVEKAILKLQNFTIRNASDINKDKTELLDLVKNNSGKTASEVFKIYNKDISYKTFRRRLEDLAESKVISLEDKSMGAKGKVTYVYFGISKNLNEF